MKTNYKLTTNSVKPCTKYDCIIIMSIADYTKIAVYLNKDGFIKSKIFSPPKKTHEN